MLKLAQRFDVPLLLVQSNYTVLVSDTTRGLTLDRPYIHTFKDQMDPTGDPFTVESMIIFKKRFIA